MRHSFSKTSFDPDNSKTYRAQCHCGAVRFEADVSPPLEADHEVVTCNCSQCFRTGAYNVYLPADKVRFTRGKDELKEYRYLAMSRKFCATCGITMMIAFADPSHELAKNVSVNARTFLGVDETKIKVLWVDMKDEEPQYGPDNASGQGK